MNAAELRSCSECGARISVKAPTCPKCQTSHPGGLNCRWCRQTLKGREATTWDGIAQQPAAAEDSNKYVYHRACLETLVPAEVIPCEVCGAMLRPAIFIQRVDIGSSFNYRSCPECGTPYPVEFGKCGWEGCGLPVFPAVHHCVLTSPVRYVREQCDGYYHATCHALHLEQLVNSTEALYGDFRYMGEYSKGCLISEWKGDVHIQEVLKRRVQKAREQGKSVAIVRQVHGPFRSLFGTIDQTGIANKSISLRNLTGDERGLAERVSAWGYSAFVSPYPFYLMVRV